MAPGDLPATLEVFHAVGWGNRRRIVEFYRDRHDTALLVALNDARIVGCGGATVLGPAGAPRSGWVHNIIVRPEARGTGLGTALTEAAIGWLRERRVPTVLLLATDLGQPIYERLGFHADIRYAGIEAPVADRPIVPPARVRRADGRDVPEIIRLDTDATGEDRSSLLQSVAGAGWVVEDDAGLDGFHLPCSWGQGPSVARTPGAGRALIELCRTLHGPGPARFGIPETNADALAHLDAMGAAPNRFVTRMWLGAPPPIVRGEMIYGVFSFAVG
jgi:GNAT superfamily N-acetyltransferase